MLARGPHLPEAFAVQVAQRRERAQEEQHKAERSVAGRVRQVLLPEDRSRQGEHSCYSASLFRPFLHLHLDSASPLARITRLENLAETTKM